MKNEKLCKTDVASRVCLRPLIGTATLEQVAGRATVCVVGVGATGIRLLDALHAQGSKENEMLLVAGAISEGAPSDSGMQEFGGVALMVMLANPNDAGGSGTWKSSAAARGRRGHWYLLCSRSRQHRGRWQGTPHRPWRATWMVSFSYRQLLMRPFFDTSWMRMSQCVRKGLPAIYGEPQSELTSSI